MSVMSSFESLLMFDNSLGQDLMMNVLEMIEPMSNLVGSWGELLINWNIYFDWERNNVMRTGYSHEE